MDHRMAEPQMSTLAGGLLTAAAAVLTGDYFVICVCALAGATWPLAAASTQTRMQGAFLLVRLVLTAAALSSVAAYLIEAHFHIPATKALAPVAFLIAAMGDRWQTILGALGDRLTRWVSSVGEGRK